MADPIFAAIERYRHACAELGTIDELTDPARYAAAEAEIGAAGERTVGQPGGAGEALLATKPVTVAGAVALARFTAADVAEIEDAEGGWSHRVLTTLADALPRLGRAA